jgi:iron complex transport system substrate-binding protein
MRIVSLLPSVTEIVCEIGLTEELVGISADSDWPPEIRDLPLVVRPSSGEPFVEQRSDPLARLHGLTHGVAPSMTVDPAALAALEPDVILTQERCRACGIVIRPAAAAAAGLAPAPEVVSLEPTSVEGIFNAITTVGAMTEAEDDAIDLVEALRARLGAIEQMVEQRRDAGHRARRVVALQRLDPPATAGHWVPEQIRRAGGWELLGEAGQPSAETSWEAIRDLDPDVLLLMPADLRMSVARAVWERTPRPAFWSELAAVRAGQVFLIDGPPYFARPGPRVIDGIELLAELLDPDGFVDASPPGSWTPLGDS